MFVFGGKFILGVVIGRPVRATRTYTLPYSLNISREKTFTDFTDLLVTSKILTLKILSCITILYYVFGIREIFITKTLKAMNPRKF